jgi:hypothetical protein
MPATKKLPLLEKAKALTKPTYHEKIIMWQSEVSVFRSQMIKLMG